MARPIPVLPLVGSTIVPPLLSTPRRSASSIIASAVRSFTLPPGFRASSLATTAAPPARGRRRRRTSGVPPIRSSTEPAIFMSASLDVIHGPGVTAPLARALDQLAEGQPVHHPGHGLGDLLPQVVQVRSRVPVAARAAGLERRPRALQIGRAHV